MLNTPYYLRAIVTGTAHFGRFGYDACPSIGCNRPTCKFCMCSLMPKTESYVREPADILADIDEAGDKYGAAVEKVFFTLASALCAPTDTLLAAAGPLPGTVPEPAADIASYAHPLDILRKTDDELRALVAAGLKRIYVGVESGSDTVLRAVHKGGRSAQVERACLRAIDAGLELSCQVILGLGGVRHTDDHAEATARILTNVSPDYVGFLSLMVTPRTKLAEEVEAGTFQLLDEKQYLDEFERIIEGTRPRRPMVVRSNHPSNHLTVRGTLPHDRDKILASFHTARSGNLRRNEEFMRNL
ncbi:radical SAM superfamily protein [Mycobacterium kansasii 732]|nr:radical SAM superfamily protein [Mycobacterium kansasii 732]